MEHDSLSSSRLEKELDGLWGKLIRARVFGETPFLARKTRATWRDSVVGVSTTMGDGLFSSASPLSHCSATATAAVRRSLARLPFSPLTMRLTQGIVTFETDVNVSLADKASVLKMLKTILANLADPVKQNDPKYRQLRLGNAKIASMTLYPVIMSLLVSLGFARITQDDGESLLKITGTVPATISTHATQVAAAYERVAAQVLQKKSLNTSGTTTTELTSKQKARIVTEQAALKEKEVARAARKRTAAQIKTDKYVRENDPNWKPAVNAAAAKSGDSITTFRDKYGENDE